MVKTKGGVVSSQEQVECVLLCFLCLSDASAPSHGLHSHGRLTGYHMVMAHCYAMWMDIWEGGSTGGGGARSFTDRRCLCCLFSFCRFLSSHFRAKDVCSQEHPCSNNPRPSIGDISPPFPMLSRQWFNSNPQGGPGSLGNQKRHLLIVSRTGSEWWPRKLCSRFGSTPDAIPEVNWSLFLAVIRF